MKQTLLLFAIACTLASCKKDDLSPEETEASLIGLWNVDEYSSSVDGGTPHIETDAGTILFKEDDTGYSDYYDNIYDFDWQVNDDGILIAAWGSFILDYHYITNNDNLKVLECDIEHEHEIEYPDSTVISIEIETVKITISK